MLFVGTYLNPCTTPPKEPIGLEMTLELIVKIILSHWVHSMVGFSAVELLRLNNEIVLIVLEERLPKSEHCITYGLVLDLSKLSLE